MSHLSHPAPARTSAGPADGPTASARPGRRLARRLPVLGGIAAGSVLLLAGPAFAHVSVQPEAAEKGGYATVNFKVPNERDDASTVKLEVNLPTDHPLASVMPQPVPGWKVEVTKTKLDKPLEMHGEKINEAPSKITWTADGKGVEPGQFQQFPVSVGQLPEDADQLVFKALQTYDDKEVVRWIEPAKEGGPEPENPAPVLKLTAATGDGHGHGAGAAGDDAKSTEDGGKHTEAAEDASGSDTLARVLAVVGIVVGIAGVGFGVLAGRRRSS
ncbi:YcnI family protein [Streptomyces sp. Pv4-95]